MKTFSLMLLMFVLTCSQSWAHSFWINTFFSQGHQSPHVMASLGWGHSLPMDDILTSTNGRVAVDSFALIDPTGLRVPLRHPEFFVSSPEQSTPNVDVYAADLAVHKIALKKNSTQGVYQFSAVTKPSYYVQYIDSKGRKRLKMKPLDEVKDVAQTLMAVKYQAYAKSIVTHGAWNAPEPLGHDLEIVPRSDLSHVKVGDLIEVEVLFYGKPLNSSPKSKEFITAQSTGFGQQDGFALYSKLKKGRAQFRVQSPGQWLINVGHKDDISMEGPLRELFGKAHQLYQAASLTFTVSGS